MRIVASLTSIPSRYDKLEVVLNDLKNQSLKLDEIYLNLPTIYRNGKRRPQLSSTITALCKIIDLEEDYGPVCKILGPLMKENRDTLIITYDDDSRIDPNSVQTLLNKYNQWSKVYGKLAIGSNGVKIGLPIFLYVMIENRSSKRNYDDIPVDVLSGFSGVLYSRNYFDDSFFDKIKRWTKIDYLRKNDDIMISCYLSSRNVKRIACSNIPIVKFIDNLRGTGLSDQEFETFKSMTFSYELGKRSIFSSQHNELTNDFIFHNIESVKWDESETVKFLMAMFLSLLLTVCIIFFMLNTLNTSH